jgi:hypothetical protein
MTSASQGGWQEGTSQEGKRSGRAMEAENGKLLRVMWGSGRVRLKRKSQGRN